MHDTSDGSKFQKLLLLVRIDSNRNPHLESGSDIDSVMSKMFQRSEFYGYIQQK